MVCIGRPCHDLVPSDGEYSPTASLPSVDLPQPDSPTRPTTSPARMASETSLTACTVGAGLARPMRTAMRCAMSAGGENRLEMFFNSSRGDLANVVGAGERPTSEGDRMFMTSPVQ